MTANVNYKVNKRLLTMPDVFKSSVEGGGPTWDA